jgi:hypothetical protein
MHLHAAQMRRRGILAPARAQRSAEVRASGTKNEQPIMHHGTGLRIATWRPLMMDIVYLGLGIALFGAAWGFVRLCSSV